MSFVQLSKGRFAIDVYVSVAESPTRPPLRIRTRIECTPAFVTRRLKWSPFLGPAVKV